MVLMEAEMRELVFVTVTTAAMALSSGASAQLSDIMRLCSGRSEVPIEQKLGACTAVIESGQETPQYRAVAFERRGLALFAKKDYDRAIADYDHALALNSRQLAAFINRGNAWQAKGNYDHAIEDYDQALRVDPKNAIALHNRGLTYQDKGRWDFDAYLNEGMYEEIAI